MTTTTTFAFHPADITSTGIPLIIVIIPLAAASPSQDLERLCSDRQELRLLQGQRIKATITNLLPLLPIHDRPCRLA